jgi:hypothetical protein
VLILLQYREGVPIDRRVFFSNSLPTATLADRYHPPGGSTIDPSLAFDSNSAAADPADILEIPWSSQPGMQ